MNTKLTFEERQTLKRRIDQARREALPTAGRMDRNPYVLASDGKPEVALWLALQDWRREGKLAA